MAWSGGWGSPGRFTGAVLVVLLAMLIAGPPGRLTAGITFGVIGVMVNGDPRFVTEAGGTVWIGTSEGVWRAGEKDAVALGYPRFVTEAGGSVWIGTDFGVWRAGEKKPIALGYAQFVTEAGGSVWIGTSQGVWRAGEKDAVALGTAWFVTEAGGSVWIGTSEGVWRAGEKDAVALGKARFVTEAGGSVWIGTDFGVWRAGEKKPIALGAAQFVTRAGGTVWIGTSQGVWRAGEKDAVALGTAWFVTEAGGTVWIGTSEGVWRAGEKDPVALGPARFVTEAGGTVWIGTDFGVWRAGEKDPVALGDAPFVTEARGTVWIGTSQGVWLAGEKDAVALGTARFVTEAGGTVWIGTDFGVWRAGEKKPIALGYAQFVTEAGGTVWIGTSQGVWRAGEKDAVALGTARFVTEAGGTVWIGTSEGVCRAGEKDLVALGKARFVTEAGGTVWIGTEFGVWRAGEKDLVAFGDPRFEAGGTVWIGTSQGVTEAGGTVWIGTSQGVWRAGEKDPVALGTARFVTEAGGTVWIGTSQGVWRAGEKEPIALGDAQFVTEAGGAVWTGTDRGLWQHLDAIPTGIRLLDGRVSVAIDYDGPDKSKIPAWTQALVVANSHEQLQEKMKQDQFSAVPVELNLAWNRLNWRQTFYSAVKTRYGSAQELPLTERVILPGAWAAAVALLLLYLLALTALIAAAPFWSLAQRLLMNPYLRKYASFGYVPLLLSLIPAVRRHILKRYRRQLLQAPELRDALRVYARPDSALAPEALLATSRQEHRTLLLADSGMGKTALLRAVAVQATVARGAPVPVYLPLGRHAGRTPEEMILGQLRNYGEIDDDELGRWFIRGGGLLLLFDGLNEVDAATRDKIVAFIDEHWRGSAMIVSSQQPYPQFVGFPNRLELGRLDRTTIDEIIRRRVPDRAEQLIPSLIEAHVALYGRPQNLAMALERIAAGLETVLPPTWGDLYGRPFQDQFTAWQADGHGDWEEMLLRRAYAMLVRREADILSDEDAPPPDGVRTFLVNQRFAVQRDGTLLFAHDLIRAYLAALHFSADWRGCLAHDGEEIEAANWLPMLQAAIRLKSGDLAKPAAVRSLANGILAHNPFVAGRLVAWLDIENPALSREWRDDFYRRFGEHEAQRLVA